MPRLIDYSIVLERMTAMGLRAAYYNGGVFAFPKDVQTYSLGWIGPPDDTIKPEARNFIQQIPPPFESNLANLLDRVWRELLPGDIWIMPAHHWAYELDFGSKQWMPALLAEIGIDPESLHAQTDASAIEFTSNESESMKRLTIRLLEMLSGSDFAIAFPARPVMCLMHHHQQLWWTSSDRRMIESLVMLT